MLPKKFRLPRDKFSFVFNKAESYHSKYFTLLYRALETQNEPIFGIIAGLKVGKANKRILCKRKLRGMIMENIKLFPKNTAYIFICKSDLINAKAVILREEFKKVFRIM